MRETNDPARGFLPSPPQPETVGGKLLIWYGQQQRDLPFRTTRDPYRIWVCEVMAQQTTLAAVVPYWQRFMTAFPDLASLAAANVDQVLALWSGLGYYRRARNLHLAAGQLVREQGGRFPETVEGIRSLPGVGAYTAAAIASICFGLPEPAIDGNVIRVLTRMGRIGGNPSRVATRRAIEDLARKLIDHDRPGEFNQALMELGSLVCRPREPSCQQCPLSTDCQGQKAGDAGGFPQTAKRTPSVAVVIASLRVVDDQGRILLQQVPAGSHNAGLWEFPSVELTPDLGEAPSPALPASVRLSGERIQRLFVADQQLALDVGKQILRVSHAITHHRITCLVYEGHLRENLPADSNCKYLDFESLDAVALTGLARKILKKL